MARYVGGIILAPVRANMARDVFICTRTKKTPGKTGRFVMLGLRHLFVRQTINFGYAKIIAG